MKRSGSATVPSKGRMVPHLTIRDLLRAMNDQYRTDNFTDPEPGVVVPEAFPPFPWSHGGYISTATTASTGTKWVTPPLTSVTITFDSTENSETDREVLDALKKTIGKYSAELRRSI